jgi:hypothetical protein
MSQPAITPFDTIESAQDFLRILAETITEAKLDIQVDISRQLTAPPSRHRDALQIAEYNLERLEKHMSSSRRILNDLRSLRRLLFAEREFRRVKAVSATARPKANLEPTPALIVAIPGPGPIGPTRGTRPASGSRASAA